VNPRRSKPVSGPDGTVYPSHAAAARALGVHNSTIRWHIDRYGDLSMIGASQVRCIWRGVEYPTLTALAKVSDRTVQTIVHHLNKYGNLDRLGVGKIGAIGNRSKSKPVRVGPYEWPSRTALAEEMGVSRSAVSRWLGGRAGQPIPEQLMAHAMRKAADADTAAQRRELMS